MGAAATTTVTGVVAGTVTGLRFAPEAVIPCSFGGLLLGLGVGAIVAKWVLDK